MNETEQKIRGQTIVKTMIKPGTWSETKKLKLGNGSV